ncbi:IS66 family insertion sequence element accessory protein TnpB [Acinetobacter baumannii]|uniref:IS66 family insertion sequence element accessory protein TnpB n=1 Tax=Acinetobacter baumannii TaxID=470 RepID=UPI002234F185|nr:IS66 family insertion sequence element accessory protein TnpB [Acinetobacter baumannii]
MIRIDEIWLSTQPMDMRAGMDTTMAQVVSLWLHQTALYLFCNKRGHRMKVLVHDGLGIWLCARRLEQGKFHWAQVHQGETVALSPEQLQALIRFALAAHWTTAGGDDALNQAVPFCYSPNVLFPLRHDLRHTAVMNTLPDLSQLT